MLVVLQIETRGKVVGFFSIVWPSLLVICVPFKFKYLPVLINNLLLNCKKLCLQYTPFICIYFGHILLEVQCSFLHLIFKVFTIFSDHIKVYLGDHSMMKKLPIDVQDVSKFEIHKE